MKRLIRIIDRISLAGGWLSGLMVCLGLTLVVAEIITRSVFNSTLYIAEEYAGYMMCGLTFLALAYTLREKGHIRMTFLHKVIEGRPRLILDLVCFALLASFSVSGWSTTPACSSGIRLFADPSPCRSAKHIWPFRRSYCRWVPCC